MLALQACAPSPGRADPDVAGAIFHERRDLVARQSGRFREVREDSILQPVEAAPECAEPEVALMVFEDRDDVIVSQPVALGIGRDGLPLDAVQPVAIAAQPDVTFAVFIDAEQRPARRTLSRRVGRDLAVLQAADSATLLRKPDVAGPVFTDCGRVRVGWPVEREDCFRVALQPVQLFIFSHYPESFVLIFVDRPDAATRKAVLRREDAVVPALEFIQARIVVEREATVSLLPIAAAGDAAFGDIRNELFAL